MNTLLTELEEKSNGLREYFQERAIARTLLKWRKYGRDKELYINRVESIRAYYFKKLESKTFDSLRLFVLQQHRRRKNADKAFTFREFFLLKKSVLAWNFWKAGNHDLFVRTKALEKLRIQRHAPFAIFKLREYAERKIEEREMNERAYEAREGFLSKKAFQTMF